MRSPATTADGVRPAPEREEGPGCAEPGRRCSPAHLRSNRPAADAQSARGGREGLSYSTAKDSSTTTDSFKGSRHGTSPGRKCGTCRRCVGGGGSRRAELRLQRKSGEVR